MHLLDWLIVLVLNGAVIGLGFYLARGTYSSGEWFLGQRALPWWGIGLSMFATNVDNADLVSVTGNTYNQGLHIITVYAIGSAAGGILASFLVVPAIYRAGFYTNAEYLEARFGLAARVLSALIQIQYRSSMLGLMLWSVFLLLTGLRIMGPVMAWVLIVSMVLCAGLYTAWGGLKSVVWTDACQGIIMLLGSAVIFWAIWNQVGGWSGMLAGLEALDRAQPQGGAADLVHIGRFGGGPQSPFQFAVGDRVWDLGPLVVVAGWTIVGSGYWTVNHTQTMRLMGARSIWDMKMAATVGVGLSLPPMIACACMGVFGRAMPQFQDLTNADELYPALAREFLTVGWKGLVVASVVAAAISTFDSMGSALSAIFTRDIYARLLVPNREDHHYVIVGRWATVGVLLLGFLYLPFILIQKNMLDAFTTLIPVFVTPLFTIYLAGVLTRANRHSGLIGLGVGSVYGLLALYCREAPKLDLLPDPVGVPLWLTNRWAALCWSLLITVAAMAVSTWLLGREARGHLLEVQHTGWLYRSSESLPALCESPFQGRTPWYLNPLLYAALLMAACLWVVFVLFW
ncbi:MAG: sodium/solute symporter [Pirellulaceae bacterium]|nr:sodium/solute symporter [Pirellulaceae bacterium]